MRRYILGTRGSPLAVAQAEIVKQLLEEKNRDLQITIQTIMTSGDRFLHTSVFDDGLKNMFTKEIEEALTARTIDLAVHSMKDMPVHDHKDLITGAFPGREDPRDVLITRESLLRESNPPGDPLHTPGNSGWGNNDCFKHLPPGSIIGTSSLRRKVQIEVIRPDLVIQEIRGNIQTRLNKIGKGYDAIVLAAAGLKRAGLGDRISCFIDPGSILPAPAQGILGVEIRREDKELLAIIQQINDPESAFAVHAERAFSRMFDGGCKSPVAAWCRKTGAGWTLSGMIVREGQILKASYSCSLTDTPAALALALGDRIKRKKV